MRFKLISCAVLSREMSAAVARSPHFVEVEFLPIGLHSRKAGAMRARLQEAADQAGPSRYDAVLFGYGLCGNGTAGLASRSVPFVIPRAHDCIALLMGGRERHLQYFAGHPDVYYRSPGWLERESGDGDSLEDLIRRHGRDRGRYLFTQFHGYQRNYRLLTYITTGVEPDRSLETRARQEAAERGWTFATVRGDLHLFHKLVSGDWNEKDFLIVPPGWRVKAVYEGRVLDKERVEN